MRTAKSSPLPKEHPATPPVAAAGHPLCLHNYSGRKKNKGNRMEGFQRWNAISDGCIKSASTRLPVAPNTENNHNEKDNRKQSRVSFYPKLAFLQEDTGDKKEGRLPGKGDLPLGIPDIFLCLLKGCLSERYRQPDAHHQPFGQCGLHTVGSHKGSQGVVLRGGEEARGGVVARPPATAEGDVDGLTAGVQAADGLEALANC